MNEMVIMKSHMHKILLKTNKIQWIKPSYTLKERGANMKKMSLLVLKTELHANFYK